MLTSILPGLRDLRTPLASGYVFLTGLWVLFAEDVPDRTHAHGVLAQVYRVSNGVGVSVLFAVLSFAAYMAGAMLTLSPSALATVLNIATGRKYSPATMRPRTLFDLETFLNATIVDFDGAARKDMKRYIELLNKWGEAPSYAESRLPRDGIPKEPTDEVYSEFPPKRLVQSRVLREVRQLVPRLHAASKDLFDDYDRLHAEAEFRLTLAAPIAFLCVCLALKWSPYFLLGIALALLLILYSFAKERAANDVVIQALCIRAIDSATIERVNQFIAQPNTSTPLP